MSPDRKVPSSIWLSVNDVARALDLHPNTIKRLSPNELPYWTSNSRGDRKYAQEDVARYVARRYVGQPPQLTIEALR